MLNDDKAENLNGPQSPDQDIPTFDRGLDYMSLTASENDRMEQLKLHLEQESNHYFTMLKHVLKAQVNLNQEIRNNEFSLRKRD